MTADVIALPEYRRVVVPVLRRDERQQQLLELSAMVIDGCELPRWLIVREVSALAHESLRFMAPMKAWTSYINAERRVLDCEIGHPDFRDVEPSMAEDDRNEALALLLDGEPS